MKIDNKEAGDEDVMNNDDEIDEKPPSGKMKKRETPTSDGIPLADDDTDFISCRWSISHHLLLRRCSKLASTIMRCDPRGGENMR
jgi:hypothetical protein